MEKLKKFVKLIFNLFKSKKIIPIVNVTDKEELLKDKVVLITGGSGGIGYAIAEKFSKSGAKVIITARDEKKLKKCVEELGKNCTYISLNQTETSKISKKVEEIINIHGKIDILVNAAGMHIARNNLKFSNIKEEEYDQIMNLNLKGTYFLTQEVSKHMIDKKINGHILMISSNRGIEPSWSPYSLSKLGLNGMTKGLAQELIKYNIIVNGIAPGPTATSMQSYKKGDSIYTDQTKLGRYTMPEEVAEYALLLVSDLGNTIVGDTIYMSGGRGIIDVR